MNNETKNQSNQDPATAKFKVGKIAILGRPNAGKSTLLNSLLESQLCATSSRPQTTRRKVSGVVQRFKNKKWVGQLVLVDTPGINLQKGALERTFFNAVEESVGDADVVIWLADARTFEKDLLDLEMDKIQEDRAANWMKDQIQKSDGLTPPQPWILVLNKADVVSKNDLLPLIEKSLKVIPQFKDVVPIAAAKGLGNKDSNLKTLLDVLDGYSKKCEPLYDRESFTDTSQKDLVREFVREAIFNCTKKEVPYQSECHITRFEEPPVKSKNPHKQLKPEVDAVIWVSRPSLKAILVGAQGKKIKEIGITARKRYEELTGQEIILKMFVKVVEKWDRRPETLAQLYPESSSVKGIRARR